MENNKTSGNIGKMSQMRLVKDIWEGLLDLVYPPKCLVCDTMQPKYLCESCLSEIKWIKPPVCSFCGMPLESGPCWECAGVDFAFDSARSVAAYEGTLKEAIHKFKYTGHQVLGPILASLIIDYLRSKNGQLQQVEYIIPIPVHPARLKHRGFNQSQILAEEIGRALSLPVLGQTLCRTRETKPQINLPIDKRHINVEGAFEVNPQERSRIDNKRILLIDDVYTTGSTSDSAARALKDAGAVKVHVLTLARSL